VDGGRPSSIDNLPPDARLSREIEYGFETVRDRPRFPAYATGDTAALYDAPRPYGSTLTKAHPPGKPSAACRNTNHRDYRPAA